MRKDVRLLVGAACLGAVATWGGRVTGEIATLELFRVEKIEVRGLRYLSEDAVVRRLGLASEASIWGDPDVWEERLLAHPLVREARVGRRIPNKLLVHVAERTPIALAPTPTLEPIDAEGYRLPLDPAELRLDLPVIATAHHPPSGSRMFPEEVRRLAAELSHLMASDTTFIQLVSSVSWTERVVLRARWTEPPVDFLLPSRTPPVRLREGLGALADAVGKNPDVLPRAIDLRFADQVVVRHTTY